MFLLVDHQPPIYFMVMDMGEAKRRMQYRQVVGEAVRKWKEVNKMEGVKVVIAGGVSLIGQLAGDVLSKPRAIAVGADPQGRMMISLQPLIGDPDSVWITAGSLEYEVKDEKVIDIYIQSTTNIIPARDLTNVRSIGGDPSRKK